MLQKINVTSFLIFFSTINFSICFSQETIINRIDTLHINCDEKITFDNKVKMEVKESSMYGSKSLHGKIKKRGGFSMAFPKCSYEIDLKQDTSFCNLPSDDDWILNANYIDKTFIRHVISYELFTAMNKNNIASKCSFAEVNLNGKYNGLYVIMEKLDKSSLRIDKNDTSAFIFKEPHFFRENYDKVKPQKQDNFHQQTYPKIHKQDKSKEITKLREFILSSNDTEFKEKFPQFFDLNNIIDWHLLLLITNNSDGILKNFYLYKQSDKTPIRIAPWDYDHSFGRDGDNELNLDKNSLDIKRSILFKRLLQFDWYKTLLKNRWNELNDINILTKENLNNQIINKQSYLKKAAKKNFKTWPTKSRWYYDNNKFKKEIKIMLRFIKKRHKRLTNYFSEL